MQWMQSVLDTTTTNLGTRSITLLKTDFYFIKIFISNSAFLIHKMMTIIIHNKENEITHVHTA